jgi:hypothetical protein
MFVDWDCAEGIFINLLMIIFIASVAALLILGVVNVFEPKTITDLSGTVAGKEYHPPYTTYVPVLNGKTTTIVPVHHSATYTLVVEDDGEIDKISVSSDQYYLIDEGSLVKYQRVQGKATKIINYQLSQ